MFDRILIPLDGSPNSEKIRHWVADLAVELESAVDLLAIIDRARLHPPMRTASEPGTADSSPEARQKAMIEEESEYARGYLRTQADWFQDRGVTVSIHVTTGDPAEAIISQSYELNSQLIAMTTSRRSAIARGVLGSVADRVLHSTGIPVLLVRPGDTTGFRDGGGLPGTVIVPVDGSNFSEKAVSYAEAIASHSGGEVLFVNGRAPNSSYTAFTMSDPAEIDGEEETQTDRMDSYLKGLVERSERRGVKARSSRSWKSAASAIIEATAESTDRMVVMTTHGSTGVKRWLLGSVADNVIRSSEHPVLVIPPEHQQVSYRGRSQRLP